MEKKIELNTENLMEHIKQSSKIIKAKETTITHEEAMNEILKIIPKVNFVEIKRKEGNNKSEDGIKISCEDYETISAEQIKNLLIQNTNFDLVSYLGTPYLYNGYYWKSTLNEEFDSFYKECLHKIGTPKWFYGYFKRFNTAKTQLIYHTKGSLITETENALVNFQNLTMEISMDGKITTKKFDKNDCLMYQLNFDYDEKATAPLFQKFLDHVLPEKEAQMVLFEYLGSLFIRNSYKIEKILALYGTGQNGKSVIWEVVTALLGQENLSNFPIGQLCKNDNARAGLVGKILNYSTESNLEVNPEILKTLASGEPVSAKTLYKDVGTIRNYAKIIMNFNTLPKVAEQTKGFIRRFLILVFDVTIPDHERDLELHKKIIENELSGVFNLVLEGLKRILENKGEFTHSKNTEKGLALFRASSDSVYRFLNDEDDPFEKTDKNHEAITLKELFELYKDFCIENGYSSVAKKGFKERLTNEKVEIKKKTKNTGILVMVKRKDKLDDTQEWAVGID